MYEYISGELVHCQGDCVVVEAGGIGYRLTVPASTSAALLGQSRVRLFVTLRQRDDRLWLYGFGSLEEREVFERVCSVAGVGPGTAITILSGIPLPEFRSAILAGEARALQKVKGIGKKTAERLIVDLREVFAGSSPAVESVTPSSRIAPRPQDDAVAALIALGYTGVEADFVVQQVCADLPGDASVQQIIRAATKSKSR